ncbi:MAG: hypothetical protein EAZ53_16710 [Bacteroidetes bacterium]|nr:MAG: hypothetical protein EAZ53_16710 [Bacteroidota bacterium]
MLRTTTREVDKELQKQLKKMLPFAYIPTIQEQMISKYGKSPSTSNISSVARGISYDPQILEELIILAESINQERETLTNRLKTVVQNGFAK